MRAEAGRMLSGRVPGAAQKVISGCSRRNPEADLIRPASSKIINMNSHDGHSVRPRPVRESQSQMAEVVLPNDANPLGNLLGGRLMHMIDIAGAMAAHRHSHSHVVTASMDHIDFLMPVHIGDLLILKSSVNRAFHTSMEVGVKCWVENYIAGTTRHV